MDLSNLSSNLPLSEEPTEASIININKELADEFKIGARSIAALYRLSNTKNSILLAKGYLDCLNDISKLLENDSISSINNLKQFISSKKKDLSSSDTNPISSPEKSGNSIKTKSEPLTLDSSYKFTINNPTNRHFPPANTPLSIDHSQLKYYYKTKNNNSKKIYNNNNNNSNNNDILNISTDEEVEEIEDENNYDLDKIKFHSSDSQHDSYLVDENTDSFSKRKITDNSFVSKKQKFSS